MCPFHFHTESLGERVVVKQEVGWKNFSELEMESHFMDDNSFLCFWGTILSGGGGGGVGGGGLPGSFCL